MHKAILNRFPVLLILIGSTLGARSQTIDTLRNRIENGYIEKIGDKLVLELSFNNAYETFEVRSGDSKTVLHPNAKTNLRLRANYRFLSLGVGFSPDLLPGNGDENKKGETKSFGLGAAFIFRHWFANANYSRVKGYYLENSEDFVDLGPGDPFIQFPDLQYRGFTLNAGYSSNPKFSLRSLTSQTERQLKSAGSFTPELNIRYYNIDDRSPSSSTQKSRNVEMSMGPGYIHTLVVKEKYYLALGVSGSLGYLNTKLTTRMASEDNTTWQDNFIVRWGGRTGIGYNGPKFYSGLYATLSGTKYNQQNTAVLNFDTRVYYQIFFGIRFNAPQYLKSKMDLIEKSIKTKPKPSKQKQKAHKG